MPSLTPSDVPGIAIRKPNKDNALQSRSRAPYETCTEPAVAKFRKVPGGLSEPLLKSADPIPPNQNWSLKRIAQRRAILNQPPSNRPGKRAAALVGHDPSRRHQPEAGGEVFHLPGTHRIPKPDRLGSNRIQPRPAPHLSEGVAGSCLGLDGLERLATRSDLNRCDWRRHPDGEEHGEQDPKRHDHHGRFSNRTDMLRLSNPTGPRPAPRPRSRFVITRSSTSAPQRDAREPAIPPQSHPEI